MFGGDSRYDKHRVNIGRFEKRDLKFALFFNFPRLKYERQTERRKKNDESVKKEKKYMLCLDDVIRKVERKVMVS